MDADGYPSLNDKYPISRIVHYARAGYRAVADSEQLARMTDTTNDINLKRRTRYLRAANWLYDIGYNCRFGSAANVMYVTLPHLIDALNWIVGNSDRGSARAVVQVYNNLQSEYSAIMSAFYLLTEPTDE